MTQETEDRARLADMGITEADLSEAMGPLVEQVERMASDQGRDPEELFLSLDEELFGAIAVGYVAAKRDGYTGTALERAAVRNTAYALHRLGRDDLAPLAAALGRRSR